MDLNNIKVSDIKEKLQAIDKKTLIKFGIGFGGVIIFLIIYYAVLSPIVEEKKALLDDKVLKENEIIQFQNEIITNKKKLKELEPKYKEQSTLFHSKAEVEGLYQSLSKYAGVNGLIISKIEKKKPKPVLKSGAAEQAAELLNINDVSYFKIPVEYEIKGNFLGYIKFKRAIAKSKKMLNFDKESISIVQNDTTGAIIATGELTIVGIPDEFFKNFLILLFVFSFSLASADNHDKNVELLKKVKEVTESLESNIIEDEDVPLNDPFAGNEGSNNTNVDLATGEERDEMSLYNFKLSGIISGKDNSYISLANSSGEILTLTLGQYLGKIKLIDLRLTEAIFKKEDETYMVIDFNQQIRETDEY